MLICKTKKWGNSLGILIPKHEVESLDLKEEQTIAVEIIKKENPLKELFGFGRKDMITKDEFLRIRKLLESKKI